jgi:hypothetical protein
MSDLGLKAVCRTLLIGSLAFATAAFAQGNTTMPDAQIEANVLRALASAPELSTQNIQTSTVYGTVTLTGNVHDEAMRSRAENLVARALGVKKVVDEMALGDTPAPPEQANPEQANPEQANPEQANPEQANAEQANAQPDQQAAPDQQPPQSQGQLQSDGTYAPAPPPPAQQDGNLAPPSQNQEAYPPQNGNTAQNPPDNGQYPGGYGPPDEAGQPGQAAQSGQYPNQAPPQGQQPYPNQAQPYPNQTQPYPGQAQEQQPPNGPPARRPMYPNNYPPQNSQNYAPPGGQQAGIDVTIPSGALLRVRIDRGLDSNHIQPGAQFTGIVLSDVAADGAIAIPRGASVQGVVVDAKKSGALKGRGELSLQISSVTLAGTVYPLNTELWQAASRDKTARTVNSAIGLGALGAILGGIAGGGAGAAIGAGVGGAAGVAGSAASPSGRVIIPPEAVLNFRMAQPAIVKTVSEQEMSRLAYAAGNGQPQPPMRRYYNPNYGYYYAPYYGR